MSYTNKLILKNFGPIKEAEIEVRRMNVFIGEQASGKSSIARLIYFFQTIPRDIFEFIYNSVYRPNNNNDYEFQFQKLIEEKFYVLFKLIPLESAIYKYSEANELEIKKTQNQGIFLSIISSNKDKIIDLINNSINGLNDIKQKINEIDTLTPIEKKNEYYDLQATLIGSIRFNLKRMFSIPMDDLLFIPSGRLLTISYFELFDSYLERSLSGLEAANYYSYRYFRINGTASIELPLMLEFFSKVKEYNKTLSWSGTFENHFTSSFLSQIIEKEQKNLERIYSIFNNLERTIIKEKYKINSNGFEVLLLNNDNLPIALKDTSSGQQESIRLIQDVFFTLLNKRNSVFRIIEEPEAHLFPEAQMALLELFALVLSANPSNTVLLTTHSPYILSSLNNLIQAYYTAQNKNLADKVNEIIPRELWLDSKEVSVYYMNRSKGTVENILGTGEQDEKEPLISYNYIDGVSEIIMNKFNSLLDLEVQDELRTN